VAALAKTGEIKSNAQTAAFGRPDTGILILPDQAPVEQQGKDSKASIGVIGERTYPSEERT
jgi:hypothetical protein